MTKVDILIKNTTLLTKDITLQKGVDIGISNGVFSSIVPTGTEAFEASKIIDGSSFLSMAGLTDGHIHTSQQLLRGRLLDEKPVIWKRVNVPFESRLDEECSRLSASLAALEMISCGTTAFVDAGGKYPEIYGEVYSQAGLKGRLSVMTNDNPFAPESLRCKSPEEGVKRLRELKKNLKGTDILPIYSVTTPTAVSEKLLRLVCEASIEDEVPFETHLNEYASEVTDFIERTGKRPFVWLEKEGYLKGQFMAPHCIFLTPEEIAVIRDNDVRIAHCPFSNCGKGVPNTPQLLYEGVKVGFGSDGSGHGGLDLFKEMRLFRGVMNIGRGINSADSEVMSAENILKMATTGGSSCLFMDKVGSVEVSNKADLILLDINSVGLFPTQNLVHSLVESASGSDVDTVIVNGKILMENKNFTTLDKDKIFYEARRLFEKHSWLNCWK
ncbi:MAG: amidohydrolase family protein [Sphaerochaetaceae bacterium]|nr:amidohydrolase family protein [Sphaerochaetaceae bacterium]